MFRLSQLQTFALYSLVIRHIAECNISIGHELKFFYLSANDRHRIVHTADDRCIHIRIHRFHDKIELCLSIHHPYQITGIIIGKDHLQAAHDLLEQLFSCLSGNRFDIGFVKIFPFPLCVVVVAWFYGLRQTGDDSHWHLDACSIYDSLILSLCDRDT